MSLMCGSFAALAAPGARGPAACVLAADRRRPLRLRRRLHGPAARLPLGDRGAARLVVGYDLFRVRPRLDPGGPLPAGRGAAALGRARAVRRGSAALPADGFFGPQAGEVQLDETQRAEFCGLPTPAAALLCASLGLIEAQGGFSLAREWLLLLAVGLGLLLISPIRMFALKFHGFGWRGNELRYLFLAACAVLIFTLRTYAIPAIVVLYIVISTVRWLVRGRPRG